MKMQLIAKIPIPPLTRGLAGHLQRSDAEVRACSISGGHPIRPIRCRAGVAASSLCVGAFRRDQRGAHVLLLGERRPVVRSRASAQWSRDDRAS